MKNTQRTVLKEKFMVCVNSDHNNACNSWHRRPQDVIDKGIGAETGT